MPGILLNATILNDYISRCCQTNKAGNNEVTTSSRDYKSSSSVHENENTKSSQTRPVEGVSVEGGIKNLITSNISVMVENVFLQEVYSMINNLTSPARDMDPRPKKFNDLNNIPDSSSNRY